MAMIDIMCPDCTANRPVPARALLATLDLCWFREPLGRLSWACLGCGQFVTAELDVGNLLRLVTAGVPLLDDGFGVNTVAEEHTGCPTTQLHTERPRIGAPFTLSDVLNLHELLENEAWVRQLGGGPDIWS